MPALKMLHCIVGISSCCLVIAICGAMLLGFEPGVASLKAAVAGCGVMIAGNVVAALWPKEWT